MSPPVDEHDDPMAAGAIGTRDERDEHDDHGALDEHGPFGWASRHLPLSATQVELLAGLVMALGAVALTAYLAREMWFNNDEWEYLANRTAFDPDSLFRPVGGHWTTWTVLLLRAVYGAVGLDFWPWFYVPRLIGHALLVTLVWRVVRHRGADPTVGIVTYAVLLVLGASGYQRALQIGNWVVDGALIVVALVITRRPDRPTLADRIVVAVLLTLAMAGNGYAVAAVGGTTVALLLARRFTTWWTSLVAPLAVYGVWYLVYGDEGPKRPGAGPSNLVHIPVDGFRVLRRAVESATGLPGALAAVGVVALTVWVVLLLRRGRLGLFEGIFLSTLVIGLALLTVQRIGGSAEIAERVRYGYAVTLLLVLALVPHLRLPDSFLARAGVVVLGLLLVVANVAVLHDEIQERVRIGHNALIRSSAAASMMLADEPVVTNSSRIIPFLETEQLQRLVDDGYRPSRGLDDPLVQEVEVEVRGALRMTEVPPDVDPPAGGAPPTTSDDVDEDGCVTIRREPTVLTVTDGVVVDFEADRDQRLWATWNDDFGTGRLQWLGSRGTRIELAEPVGTAELALRSRWTPRVCGVAPAD